MTETEGWTKVVRTKPQIPSEFRSGQLQSSAEFRPGNRLNFNLRSAQPQATLPKQIELRPLRWLPEPPKQ
jgi:hypothetical protein